MTIANMRNMRLFFKGVKIDERTEVYINKRLAAIQKILRKILNIEVEIDFDKKGKFRVEVMIKTPYSLYRAEEVSGSIEGSIDAVCEKLKVQIKKEKDKMITLRHRGGRSLKKKYVINQSARF